MEKKNVVANCRHGLNSKQCPDCIEDAARKRVSRAAEKAQEAIEVLETIQDFWAVSLPSANPKKLAEWQARQEYVEALLGDIRTVLEGRSPDEEFITDVDDEVRADIKEFGEAGITPILLIGKFWQNPELLSELTSGDTPTTVFARFGILTALPDVRVHQWKAFTQKRRSEQPQQEVFYVPIRCTQCNDLPTSVSSGVAAAYNRTRGYICQSCIDKAAKVRDFAHQDNVRADAMPFGEFIR